uniref:Uncharacterized protein n=1 Tax=Ditylenchus dipsaci TaxID=166011 RepID=A0A915CX84_9BILA
MYIHQFDKLEKIFLNYRSQKYFRLLFLEMSLMLAEQPFDMRVYPYQGIHGHLEKPSTNASYPQVNPGTSSETGICPIIRQQTRIY